MKLFLHDRKHEQILAELDLGEISHEQEALLDKIINFLDEQGVTDRYKDLMLANGYTQGIQDGESVIEFD